MFLPVRMDIRRSAYLHSLKQAQHLDCACACGGYDLRLFELHIHLSPDVWYEQPPCGLPAGSSAYTYNLGIYAQKSIWLWQETRLNPPSIRPSA